SGSGVTLGSTDSSAFGYSYAWIPSTGLDDPLIARPVASPIITTLYTLIVSGQNIQGCDALDQVLVTVQPSGNIMVNAGPDTAICEGSAIQIGPDEIPGLLYSWSPSQGLDDPTAAQPWAQPSLGTMYTLEVKDTMNCLKGSDDILVEVQPLPLGPAGPDVQICSGDQVMIGMAAINGALYSWSPAAGLDDPYLAQPLVSAVSSQNYTLSLSIGNCTITDEMELTVNPLPIANAGPDHILCSNAAASLGVLPSSGFSYSWYPSFWLSNPTIANPTANPPDTTEYILSVVDLTTACKASDTVNVKPAATADAGPDKSICRGDSVQIGMLAEQGATYLWSPSTGLSATNIANPIASPTSTRTYTLRVTKGSCTRTDNVIVTVRNPGSISIQDPGVFCQNACKQLSVIQTPGPYTQYEWFPPDVFSNPDIKEPIVCLSQTSSVSLSALHQATGCSVKDTITLFVNPVPSPVANAGNDTSVCYGNSTVLGTPGPDSLLYSWSPPGIYSPDQFNDQPEVFPYSTTMYYLTVL
ncbi:MAG: hypothetical protein IH599_00225, partial [Bacteroidales bacterium]|nr:hypothetical protein [Bacteroidales bacterium]